MGFRVERWGLEFGVSLGCRVQGVGAGVQVLASSFILSALRQTVCKQEGMYACRNACIHIFCKQVWVQIDRQLDRPADGQHRRHEDTGLWVL